MNNYFKTAFLVIMLSVFISIPVSAAPEKMKDGGLFDAEYYAATNPDVVSVLGSNKETLYNHYKEYGQKEGRLPYSPDGTTQSAPVAATTQKTPIEIYRVFIRETNSVGGVCPNIVFRNNSGKTIKYITFSMVPYNAVGDIVRCDVRGYSTYNGKVTGPIEPTGIGNSIYRNGMIYSVNNNNGSYVAQYGSGMINGQLKRDNNDHVLTQEELLDTILKGHYWDCAWYNWDIKSIGVTGIKIDYMDGTSQKVKPETVMSLEKQYLPFVN